MGKINKIAIDFDGTIVKHAYPDVGAPVPGAIHWMKHWQALDAKLILWTMRADGKQRNGEQRKVLTEALEYCAKEGIIFAAVNKGIGDRGWTESPKAHAHIYVDDAAFGCPLITPETGRPYVNWAVVGPAVSYVLID